MTTPFTVIRGEETKHERAYVINVNGGKTIVYTGNIMTMTKKRKAAMMRDALGAIGKDVSEATEDVLADAWTRNPFCRYDDLTIWHTSVTDNATGEVRIDYDYSHTLGGGTLPAATTIFRHIA